MIRTATISECKQYRYLLTRTWGNGPIRERLVTFIMLNPSKADALVDDRTVTRCIGFAASLRAVSFNIVNLFAFRTAYPEELWIPKDPVGPDNDYWLDKVIACSPRIIVGWGNSIRRDRIWKQVRKVELLCAHYKREVLCLGTTADGQPRHPLFLKKTITPIPYNFR